MLSKLKVTAIAVFSAALGLSASASHAATIVQSGNTYGGWAITVPAGIALDVDSTSGNTLVLEKFAAFPSDVGLPIMFTQTSGSALPTIEFVNEQVTNLSGTGWAGFQYQLVNVSSTMGDAAASFSGTTFSAPAGFSSPTVTSTDISYPGSQANGTTVSWGFGGNGLFINAAPANNLQPIAQDFVFKEIPITSVAMPAAVWQSMAGLMGLSLIALARNAKKLVA